MKGKLAIRVTGIDIGNNSTNTSEGLCFPSQVTRGEVLKEGALAIKVRWNGNYFIIGDSDEAVKFRDTEKVFSDEYKVCLLTALALSHPETHIRAIVGIGLPYGEYSGLKEIYRNELLRSLKGEQQITIYSDSNDKDGVTKYINIEDFVVSPEGSILDYLSDDEIPAMVVDFGGRTLDLTTYALTTVSENQRQVKKIKIDGTTDNTLSFDDVLDKMKKTLHEKSYSVRTDQELIAILDQDQLKVFGGSINFKAIRDTQMNIYAHRVIRHLQNHNLSKYFNVKFLGGCAEIVKQYLESLNLVPKGAIEVLPSPQFFNSINFKQQAKKTVNTVKYAIIDEE